MNGVEQSTATSCRVCSHMLGVRAAFCKHCGEPVGPSPPLATPQADVLPSDFSPVRAATGLPDSGSQATASQSQWLHSYSASGRQPSDAFQRAATPALEPSRVIYWSVAGVAIVALVAFLTVIIIRSTATDGAGAAEKQTASTEAAAPPPPRVETEREEIIRLVRTLMAGQKDLAQLNESEVALVPPVAKLAKDIQFWGVMGSGSRYAGQATSASSDSDRARQGLKKARTTLEVVPLNFAYAQTKRSELVTDLKRRESFLGDLSTRLTQASRDLSAFRSAFSYPRSVKALSDHTDRWRSPKDTVSELIQAMRLAHGIADRELGPTP